MSRPPEEVAEIRERCYGSLFGRIAERGGFVSDVVGDAMVAIWPDRPSDTRRRVLLALLEMRDAVEQFGQAPAAKKVKPRFGADWGRAVVTTAGTRAHPEYRAAGEAVDTSKRLLELNERLGTCILVSDAALGSAGGEFLLRNLGRFLLRGMSHAVQVHELVALKARASAAEAERCGRTAEAVEFLDRGDAAAAKVLLAQVRDAYPEDAPSAFLLDSLESGLPRENGAWVVS